MIEKDNIKELFSRTLENHTSPVRPEVWNGLQAKMAAAGVSSVGAGAAAKGLSALTKWMIGSAAVAGTAVVTTIALVNSPAEQPKKNDPVKTVTTPVASQQTPETLAHPADGTQTVTQGQQQAQTSFERPSVSNDWIYDEIPGTKTPVDKSATEAFAPGGNPQTTNTDPVYSGQTVPEKPVIIETGREDEPKTESNQESAAAKNYEAAKIEYPNVFTPNGDGMNDKYYLLVHDNIKSIDIVITDTQNKVVYRSSDPAFEWDGTYNGNSGEPVPDGMYACSVVYKDKSDTTIKDIILLEVKRK